MKARGALMWNPGTRTGFTVEEIEIDPPKDGEVMVKMVAAGLCHSDLHYDVGDGIIDWAPMLGGHEGAGIVTELGEGVTGIAVGDHVITTFIPSCGTCRWCVNGMGNLCDRGAGILSGLAMDGTHRIHARGQGVGAMAYVGTFAEYIVCPESSLVVIDKDIPLDKAAIVGCAVPTGWGSAVHLVEVGPGDTVVVLGTGGVGMNAVQGARAAGAKHIVAVDPVEWKRDAAHKFGATHAAADIAGAHEIVMQLTNGVGAEKGIITKGISTGDEIQPMLDLICKSGVLGLTGVSAMTQIDAKLNIFGFAMLQKQLRGGLYGTMVARTAFPLLLDLYRKGQLMLDELVTTTYTLDEVNQGFKDMEDGKNIRGVIVFD